MSVPFVSSKTLTGIFATALLALLSLPLATAQTFNVIYDAEGGNNGISNPESRIVTQGRDGNMYFTANTGGTDYGSFFKTSASGATSIVYDLGGFPNGGGSLGTDGNFYATNDNLGFGFGQVVKISPGGGATVLYSFNGDGDGANPEAAPIQASNGIFYGTTPNGGSDGSSTAYSITSAGTFNSLHSFLNSEGSGIVAELLPASDGNLYGMAPNGGTYGDGTIFKMTPSGTVTVLHNFNGGDNVDGSHPCCGLFQANDGNLYGGTANGGAYGSGEIFQYTLPGGVYTILHSIDTAAGEGINTNSTLTQGSDGNLYGVTTGGNGGANGTLFSMSTSGAFTTLYTFCVSGTCTDGSNPSSQLKQNTNGIFYGVTSNGGDLSCGNGIGCGVVYSLNVGLKAFASLVTTFGEAGTTVGIRGQGFSSSSVVSFNGVSATKVIVANSRFLLATVPTGATTGFVTVTTGTTKLTSSQRFVVR